MSVLPQTERSRGLSRSRRLAVMLRAGVMAGVGIWAGCSTTKKVDNPVVGPRPPRVSEQMLASMAGEGSREGDISSAVGTGVEQTAGTAERDTRVRTAVLNETAASGMRIIHDEDVAARVNGRPIFVSEVLERYRPQLEAQRSQMPPAAYEEARRQLLAQELPGFIEQALVIDAVRKQFKKDQWDELQGKLDEIFYEDEVANLQTRLKVSSLKEVEAKMQEAGTSLSAYRRVWGERQLAGQWVSEKLPAATASRQELLDEYNQRLDDYREPEQVKWQQCWISHAKSGGRDAAREQVEQAIEDLKTGKSFDDIVATYSEGPRSADGGYWDWTQSSSLADVQLRETLTALKLNQIGPVLEDDRGFRLVKLVGYRPARVIPFEEVQTELREIIAQRKRADAAQEIIDELKAAAHIETILEATST